MKKSSRQPKNPLRALSSESGVTLIELMIVASIIGVVALGTSTMISNTIRQMQSIEKSADWMQVLRRAEMALSDPNICQQIFNGNSITFGALDANRCTTSITMGNPISIQAGGSVIIEPDLALNDNYTVQSNPQGVQFTSACETDVGTNVYLADLTINVDIQNQIGAPFDQAVIPMRFETDGANTITSCSSLSQDAGNLCSELFNGEYATDGTNLPNCMPGWMITEATTPLIDGEGNTVTLPDFADVLGGSVIAHSQLVAASGEIVLYRASKTPSHWGMRITSDTRLAFGYAADFNGTNSNTPFALQVQNPALFTNNAERMARKLEILEDGRVHVYHKFRVGDSPAGTGFAQFDPATTFEGNVNFSDADTSGNTVTFDVPVAFNSTLTLTDLSLPGNLTMVNNTSRIQGSLIFRPMGPQVYGFEDTRAITRGRVLQINNVNGSVGVARWEDPFPSCANANEIDISVAGNFFLRFCCSDTAPHYVYHVEANVGAGAFTFPNCPASP